MMSIQKIGHSFLILNLSILLVLSITFGFAIESSLANNFLVKPSIATEKEIAKSKVKIDADADKFKAKTLEAMDRSIGKSSEKPSQQNRDARESNQNMENEARDAFK